MHRLLCCPPHPPGAAAAIDSRRKLLSYLSAALLALVPWMQVRKGGGHVLSRGRFGQCYTTEHIHLVWVEKGGSQRATLGQMHATASGRDSHIVNSKHSISQSIFACVATFSSGTRSA